MTVPTAYGVAWVVCGVVAIAGMIYLDSPWPLALVVLPALLVFERVDGEEP